MLKMWWRIALLGVIGAVTLMLVPVEELAPIKIEPVLLRLLSTLQPIVLVLALAGLGTWAAAKVELDAPAVRAWADRQPIWPVLRRQLPAAIAAGLATAAVLVAFTWTLRSMAIGEQILRFAPPLPTRLLYGGLTEEVLLRWGVMSLLAWLGWRLAGRPASIRPWVYVAAILLAALLFAAGHLPALSFLLPDAPRSLVMLVLAANFIPGVLFGWLFWRRGLEAAMLAHGSAHFFAWSALLLL
jgi:CAAX prenyl protease-like protein